MNLFGLLGVSGSALTAERVRAEVTASNMANAETTRTSDGKLFQRQHVVFQSIGPVSNDVTTGGMLGGTFAEQLSEPIDRRGMEWSIADGNARRGRRRDRRRRDRSQPGDAPL